MPAMRKLELWSVTSFRFQAHVLKISLSKVADRLLGRKWSQQSSSLRGSCSFNIVSIFHHPDFSLFAVVLLRGFISGSVLHQSGNIPERQEICFFPLNSLFCFFFSFNLRDYSWVTGTSL